MQQAHSAWLLLGLFSTSCSSCHVIGIALYQALVRRTKSDADMPTRTHCAGDTHIDSHHQAHLHEMSHHLLTRAIYACSRAMMGTIAHVQN